MMPSILRASIFSLVLFFVFFLPAGAAQTRLVPVKIAFWSSCEQRMMTSLNTSPEQISDLCDKEFYYYINLSKGLIENLRAKYDRRICINWIRKLCRLSSTDIHVKISRNAFFKYLLQMMLHGVATDEAKLNPDSPFYVHGAHATLKTIQNPQWLMRQLAKQEKQEKTRPRPPNIIRWSKDKRTYLSIKPLPGEGALIYMAVSKDPKLGWDYQGTPYS